MPIDLERYNQRVQDWATGFVSDSRAAAQSMGVQHRDGSPSKGPSLSKIKSRVGLRNGVAEKVGVKFPRSLIYTQKGAGKGRGGSKGSRWINKYGNTATTNPRSLGKMGGAGRTAKPFFNNALDAPQGVGTLADIAAEEIGGVIVNNLFIK